MFVYLVTGAALPDEGTVVVAGRDTREIATETSGSPHSTASASSRIAPCCSRC